MNKLFLGILMLLLIMPFVSALEDADADYLIKQNSRFDIKRNCIYNGTWCTSVAECNITINSIQGTGGFLYNNTPMTNQGGFHNLTLNASDNNIPGWYQTMVTCTDRGDEGSEFFYYRVTPTGDEDSTTFFIIISLAFIAIIIFGYVIQQETLVFMGGATALVLGMYSMIYGFGSTQNDYTSMLSVIIIGIGLIFVFMSAYHLIESRDTSYEEME